jgi:CRP/FNR family cyclic AMP-dependent transcriptional regulator
MLPLCRYAIIGQMLIGCPVCDLLGLDRHCQGRLLVGSEFINTYDQGGIHFFSIASAAANFRSTCGSERGAPECSTQRSPAATPHVGQGTEDNCSGVSSFLFILTECPNTLPRNRSVLNIFRNSTLRTTIVLSTIYSRVYTSLGLVILRHSPSSGGVMQVIANPSNTESKGKSTQKRAFDAQAFLDSAGVARRVVEYRRLQKIYSQGDPATSVMYLQMGGVKLSVANEVGKEAVVAILGPGDFFGEGCLAGQQVRMATATAITSSAVLVIEKKEMMRVLHTEHAFSDRFMSHMLSRNIRIEEDLIDQLFNSSEKRLARTLLLLARYGKESQPQKMLPKISQAMLAEMIGTTRSRVNFFMNKFRKLGFVQYNGEIHVNDSLLSVVLHE